VVLAHVAEAARVLGQPLAGGRLPSPLDPEVLGLEELGAGEQRDAGRAEDFHQVWGVRCRVSGVASEIQFWNGPPGGALDLAQAGGDVVGNRRGVGTDLQVGERLPIGRGKYNAGIEDAQRVVRALEVAE